MCGIVAYIGQNNAVPILFEGLQRLEYRGYDSAGVAVIGRSGLKVHKRAGRVDELVESAPKLLRGTVGIGHTRWATPTPIPTSTRPDRSPSSTTASSRTPRS